jgi:tetratricopeptide (TPR) repeat protein
MSKSLYEEAIEAAEQIKFAAEEKVKEKLVESMSPRIKSMVEKTFLNESMNEDPDECCESEEATEECGMPESEANEAYTMDGDSLDFFLAAGEERSDEAVVSESAKSIFSKLITKNNRKIALQNKLSELQESIKTLKKALILSESTNVAKQTEKRFLLIYKNLLREAKSIKSNSIIKSDNTLLKEYLQIIKELKNMSRRRRTRSGFLNESLEDLLETNLFEEDGDKEEAPEDADLDASEDNEELMDLDEPMGDMDDEGEGDLEDLVRKFIDDAEPMLGAGAAGGDNLELDLDDEGEDEGEDEGDDMDMAEEGHHLDRDLDEMYELDELEEGDIEEDEDPAEGVHESRRRNRVLEIDENMLRKEISKMRRIREGEAKDMASHFGGGSLDKEMFVDMDDGDLNVHAGQLGREDVPSPKVESALRNAARKNRMLESKMKDYKKALRGMKTQLSEMNLFNAKLLYANKLMQNRELSIKQQRHIVESLDEAKNLGEAKILFESLSKSLVKSSPRSGQSMNESVSRNTAGYSSRPVSSAQSSTLTEGVALDRWATLAGIKK